MNQAKKMANFTRVSFGRKSLPPNLMEKLRAPKQEMTNYFKAIQVDMDAAMEADRRDGKSERWLIYCSDIQGYI